VYCRGSIWISGCPLLTNSLSVTSRDTTVPETCGAIATARPRMPPSNAAGRFSGTGSQISRPFEPSLGGDACRSWALVLVPSLDLGIVQATGIVSSLVSHGQNRQLLVAAIDFPLELCRLEDAKQIGYIRTVRFGYDGLAARVKDGSQLCRRGNAARVARQAAAA
jgi:hypothetical protein